MPNRSSVKKALRASKRKKQHNSFWKKRIRNAIKAAKASKNSDSSSNEFKSLQKILDKAAKEKVIHKNKANRLKSRYAKKLSARSLAKTKVGATQKRRARKSARSAA